MNWEDEDDLEVFFADGQRGIYVAAAGGKAVEIMGIRDNPYEGVSPLDGMELAGSAPSFLVASHKLPANRSATGGDRLTIGAEVFKVRRFEPGEDGRTTRILLSEV